VAPYDGARRSSRGNFAGVPTRRIRRVADPSSPLSVRAVVRDTARLSRRHARFLILFAALVWLPLALLELSGAAHGIRIDDVDLGELLVGLVVVLVFELLTTELLAAASEKMVGNDVHGTRLPTFGEFLRTVPWGGLLLGALVYEAAVAIGLLLFVVPGVLMFVWGVVSGPVIVAEGCRATRAPWRSRELVRGSFRTVLLVAILGLVFTELVAGAVAAVLDSLPHDWVLITGEYFVHVVTTPVLGMGTAVLYYALLDRERVRTRDEPAAAGSS